MTRRSTALALLLLAAPFARGRGQDFRVGRGTVLKRGHSQAVNSIAFSPDGLLLASTGRDGLVLLWDVQAARTRLAIASHRGSVNSVAFSPDGRWLASGGDDRTIRLWDVAGRKEAGVLAGGDGAVSALAISPDGMILASGGWDGQVRVWELRRSPRDILLGAAGAVMGGRRAEAAPAMTPAKQSWKAADGSVNATAFSPDGQTLATGGWDGDVQLWDARSGRRTALLKGHADWVVAVAFSSDGRWLASAGRDRTVRVWDLKKSSQRFSRRARALSVAFSPDSRILAAAGSDGVLRFWSADRGVALGSLRPSRRSLRSLAFSPDGDRLGAAGDDRQIRLYKVAGADFRYVRPRR